MRFHILCPIASSLAGWIAKKKNSFFLRWVTSPQRHYKCRTRHEQAHTDCALKEMPTTVLVSRTTGMISERALVRCFRGRIHDNSPRFGVSLLRAFEIKLRKKNYFLHPFMTLLNFLRSLSCQSPRMRFPRLWLHFYSFFYIFGRSSVNFPLNKSHTTY